DCPICHSKFERYHPDSLKQEVCENRCGFSQFLSSFNDKEPKLLFASFNTKKFFVYYYLLDCKYNTSQIYIYHINFPRGESVQNPAFIIPTDKYPLVFPDIIDKIDKKFGLYSLLS